MKRRRHNDGLRHPRRRTAKAAHWNVDDAWMYQVVRVVWLAGRSSRSSAGRKRPPSGTRGMQDSTRNICARYLLKCHASRLHVEWAIFRSWVSSAWFNVRLCVILN